MYRQVTNSNLLTRLKQSTTKHARLRVDLSFETHDANKTEY